MYYVYGTDNNMGAFKLSDEFVVPCDYYADKGLDRLIKIGDTEDSVIEEFKWSDILNYYNSNKNASILGIERVGNVFVCSPHSVVHESARLLEVFNNTCIVLHIKELKDWYRGTLKPFSRRVEYSMPELLSLVLTSGLKVDGLSKWIDNRIIKGDSVVLGKHEDGRYFLVNWNKTINHDLHDSLYWYSRLRELLLNDMYFHNSLQDAIDFCKENNLHIMNELYSVDSHMFAKATNHNWDTFWFDTVIVQRGIAIEVNFFIRDLCYPLLCKLYSVNRYKEYELYYSKLLCEFILVTEGYQFIFSLLDFEPSSDNLKYAYNYKKMLQDRGFCISSASIRKTCKDLSQLKVKEIPIVHSGFSASRSMELLKDVFYN